MRMQLLVLLAAAELLFAVGCGREAHRHRRGATVERLPKLEVVTPQRKRLKRWLEVAATVEALQKVEISARVPGVVDELDARMDIGRTVRGPKLDSTGKEIEPGEVLLRLAVPELEADKVLKNAMLGQARKLEKLAEEAVTVARREVEETEKEEQRYKADAAFHKIRTGRIRELVKQRAQDPQVLEEATKQYEAADAALAANHARTAKMKARVSAAEAEVELSKEKIKVAEADVKRLDEQVAFATVRAPFDGVITRRWIDKGAIIKDPGATLLTVMHIDRVRVLIDVPQRDVPLLNAREQNPNPDGKGDLVELFLPALAEQVKDGKFEGSITRASRSLDPVTRTMRAEIELDNPKGYLQPGMYGKASVLIEDRSNILTVPAAALVRRGEGSVEVYIVADPEGNGDERKGVLRRLPVVLGIDDGKEVEIRSGLKGDELIVARGNGAMRADDRVIAVREREAVVEK